MRNFVEELLKRTHNVTFLTSLSMGKQSIANYTEVLIDPTFDPRINCALTSIFISFHLMTIYLFVGLILYFFFFTHNKDSPETLFYYGDKSAFVVIRDRVRFSSSLTNFSLASKNVRDFINQSDLHFDVVINEEFFHDAFSMFGHRFSAPVVTICKQDSDV